VTDNLALDGQGLLRGPLKFQLLGFQGRLQYNGSLSVANLLLKHRTKFNDDWRARATAIQSVSVDCDRAPGDARAESGQKSLSSMNKAHLTLLTRP